MKRLVMMVLVLVAIGGTTEASAQSWLDQLGKKVKEKAKDKVEQKILQKTDQVIEKAFDKTEEAVKGNGGNQTGVLQEAAPQQPVQQAPAVQETPSEPVQEAPQPQSLEMTYAKSDFVAGDEIIFDDPMDNEQLGEFPSQWELIDGVAEVVSINGKKAILISEWGTKICPLMKDPLNFLGDVFTVEYDLMFPVTEGDHTWLLTKFMKADNKSEEDEMMYLERAAYDGRDDVHWYWETSRGNSNGEYDIALPANEWNHVAISFNKRAWKVYFNGIRVVNVPNVLAPPGWLLFQLTNGNGDTYITNLRIAKGAVPLYDRMMSEGKFVTYGITFDVGKATIKPESMGEINRIVQLMNENPTLKFSVEGHTDSTGNAASNQTLSEQRSQAIVDKLVELGIAQDRLTAVGKGQNSPIADNNTDEGRAKNRRVEFVKI
ncbi:MAG: OmpA family protein [Bacteroidales bacterium]|nr:OmpA family protein [Bacteroidales bacterium]MBQ6880691.1 OmpA family protein [Bacteroidales bacterium]